MTSIHPQRNNNGNNSIANLFLFKYLSPGSPTATSFKKEEENSMFKNRPAIILFSPAMGRKGEMSRVIHQGEFIDYNFFKRVITLMAD